MRIAILLHWNEGEKSGVFKKVLSQVRIWKSQNYVSLHVVSRRPLSEVWKRSLEEVPFSFHLYSAHSATTRLRAWREAVEALKGQRPDVVYHRYDLYMPALKELSQSYPLVLEINTDDLAEYCLRKGLRCLYNRFTRALLLRKAGGLIFVTHELAQLPHFACYRKPFSVVSNGIVLDDYLPLPPPRNEEPRLVFLGAEGQPWHGIDKVIRMAQLFPQWHFDIVGVRPGKLYKTPSNVSLYGPLERQTYEPILAQADIAIGSLALHRNGMNEACPLKVREYLAYGLPVIIGYKDTDFPEGAPFILQLPNTEDNVESNVEAIKRFTYQWRGQRVPRDALSHLDMQAKETLRLDFFRQLLGGSP